MVIQVKTTHIFCELKHLPAKTLKAMFQDFTNYRNQPQDIYSIDTCSSLSLTLEFYILRLH
jgi:hypothetical protein